MNIVDYILIAILILSAIKGYKTGLIPSVVNVVGVILVFVIAFYIKNPIADMLFKNLPFLNFGGIFTGITVANILFYEAIAYGLSVIVLGIVFTFSSVISFEYQNNAWMLINVSKKGKSGVIKAKIIVCIILTALFSIIPFTLRYISINKAFSMHGLLYGIQNILVYRNMPIWMNILTFILIKIITQIIILIITTMIVIGISRWRKNNAQAIFFSILILCVPIILMILGFNFMKYLSLYGAYSYLY